eukprot:scaffold17442_cov99-Isochrysis_galbana.AAC.4
MSGWGFQRFRTVRRSYKPLNLLSWYVAHQTEQKEKHDAIQGLPGNTRHKRHIDVEVDSTDTGAQ